MTRDVADPDSRAGVRYVDPELIRYVDRVHVPHDAALASAYQAPERQGLPAIQVSASEGKLLGVLLRVAGARKVVEVGTLAGYSALHMARMLPSDARLWTIENEPAHAEIAREEIRKAALDERVEVLEGDAGEVLGGLASEAPFDAVFLDADKSRYPEYGAWAAEHVRRGGLLLADNAYYFGKLLADDAGAAAMRRFHEEAAERFETVCVPTPDGLLVGIKR